MIYYLNILNSVWQTINGCRFITAGIVPENHGLTWKLL